MRLFSTFLIFGLLAGCLATLPIDKTQSKIIKARNKLLDDNLEEIYKAIDTDNSRSALVIIGVHRSDEGAGFSIGEVIAIDSLRLLLPETKEVLDDADLGAYITIPNTKSDSICVFYYRRDLAISPQESHCDDLQSLAELNLSFIQFDIALADALKIGLLNSQDVSGISDSFEDIRSYLDRVENLTRTNQKTLSNLKGDFERELNRLRRAIEEF